MADWFVVLRRRARSLSAPPALAVDALIAALCYFATVALPVEAPAPGGWSFLVLAALASLPLVWRRSHPVPVAVLVGVGTVGLAMTNALNGIPLPYGQLVATYTIAAFASPLWRLLAATCTGIGIVVSVVVLLGQGPAILGTAALPFVAAYALGTGVRARRDRISMLEERTVHLAEEQRATAALERERIAREIHDIVAHSVSIMVIQAEAGLVVAGEPNRARATFDTISATGREALTQLDRALGVLRGDGTMRHPQPGLDDIPQLVEEARLAGLDASLAEHDQARPVPADLATAAYRLVQEAVTNTIRHAHAQRMWVRLDWQATGLRLEIADDGHGPAASGNGGGHGLIGMRERVHAFGGDLYAGVGDGGIGFRVTASLPTGPQPAALGPTGG